jgi:ABC-type nitrate/sulfonate/bicarbonate transport system substrate-binding protein
VKDLVGRTVGVGALGAAMHQKIVALLRKRGIDEKSVRFVDLGSTLDIFKAVREGRVDAGPADIDVYADQARYGVHSLSDGNLWTDLREYTNQASYAMTDALAHRREGLIRIVAAYARLYRFLESPASREPWLKAAAKRAGTAVPTQPDPLWKLYQSEKPFPARIALSPDRIAYVQELNVTMGLQRRVLPYDQVADTSIAREALRLIG